MGQCAKSGFGCSYFTTAGCSKMDKDCVYYLDEHNTFSSNPLTPVADSNDNTDDLPDELVINGVTYHKDPQSVDLRSVESREQQRLILRELFLKVQEEGVMTPEDLYTFSRAKGIRL